VREYGREARKLLKSAGWSRGRHRLADRTGQEPGRAVGRSLQPRRSARSVPRAGAGAAPGRGSTDVTRPTESA